MGTKPTVHKLAVRLDVGDVITEYPIDTHPERLGEPGRWTVIRRTLPDSDGFVRVDYQTSDDLNGLFVIHRSAYVMVEPVRS